MTISRNKIYVPLHRIQLPDKLFPTKLISST